MIAISTFAKVEYADPAVGNFAIKPGAYGLANVAPTVVQMMGLTAPDCWEESII